MSCKYANIFGKPNEGVHSYRFMGIAIVDLVLTILFALMISYFFNTPFPFTLIVLLLLGVFFHHWFCVRTTVDKLLFKK